MTEIDYSADVQNTKHNSEAILKDKVSELVDKNNVIAEKEQELERLIKERNQLSRQDLPDLLSQVGDLTKGRINLGSNEQPRFVDFELKDKTKGSVNDTNRDTAIPWLVDNGYDGDVKIEIVLKFNRGEHERALAIQKLLQENGVIAECKESVHWNSVSRIIRERLSAQQPVPLDILNGIIIQEVTVKPV